MKTSAARDLTVGGPTLAAHAFNAGLVDECHLFICPVLVGRGKAAFPSDAPAQLELLEEHRFGNGVVYLRYRAQSWPYAGPASGWQVGCSGAARRVTDLLPVLERGDLVAGRVAGAINGVEERLTVVANAAMLDAVAVSIGVNDDVAGAQVIGDRVADAPEVHRSKAADNTIGRLVGVTGKHQVRVRSLEVACELLVASVRGDAVAIVSAW